MLVELSIIPVGESAHTTGPVASVIDLIARSGLRHQVTDLGTIIEGEDDAVWSLVRRCHEEARRRCERVVTELRVDDGAARLGRGVRRVEEELARPVARTP